MPSRSNWPTTSIRGESNPIFSGAAGIWDNVLLHEYDKIFRRTGNAGHTVLFEAGDPIAKGVTVARALFCGAQAGILAYGRKVGWKEKVFEYDSQFGVEVSSIYGFSGWDVGLKVTGSNHYAVWFGQLYLGEIDLETESFYVVH
jgi:hypothetical protein